MPSVHTGSEIIHLKQLAQLPRQFLPFLPVGVIMSIFRKISQGPSVRTGRTDSYGDLLPPGAVGRLGTGRLQHIADQGNEGISALAFSPDGTMLAAAGFQDGRISLW